MCKPLQFSATILCLAVTSIPGVVHSQNVALQQPHSLYAPSHSTKRIGATVVPPYVIASWKAVRISVTDKITRRKALYTVPIGGDILVPKTSMRISVETFLPAFIMEGPVMTTESNNLTNPAAKVVITDADSVIFKGWLFMKHSSSHAFMHPVYGFSLVDVIARN